MAGMHKHKWSYTVKYAPDHFGHNQFRPPKRVVTNRWLNLYDLERLAHGSDRDGVIDLTSLGFDKLLGQGEITRPYKLKIARASASAVEKVNAAGGSIEMEELHRTENTPDTQQKDSKAEKNKDTPAVKRRS
jgi:large subunit ribosomal protein L15